MKNTTQRIKRMTNREKENAKNLSNAAKQPTETHPENYSPKNINASLNYR